MGLSPLQHGGGLECRDGPGGTEMRRLGWILVDLFTSASGSAAQCPDRLRLRVSSLGLSQTQIQERSTPEDDEVEFLKFNLYSALCSRSLQFTFQPPLYTCTCGETTTHQPPNALLTK